MLWQSLNVPYAYAVSDPDGEEPSPHYASARVPRSSSNHATSWRVLSTLLVAEQAAVVSLIIHLCAVLQ